MHIIIMRNVPTVCTEGGSWACWEYGVDRMTETINVGWKVGVGIVSGMFTGKGKTKEAMSSKAWASSRLIWAC